MGPLELYHYLNTEIADPRTNDWFLVSSPVPVILLSLAYLYFVLRCGPRYMKDRNPYKLQVLIRMYNFFQIMANAWVVREAIRAGWYRNHFMTCRSINYSRDSLEMRFAHLAWYVLLLKLFDFMETCIFVLRKKIRQVSFLHLYHHISTIVVTWMFVKYFAFGTVVTIAVVNSLVHVIMYTYYLISSYGPSMQRYLNPIKRIITTIQMVQFIFLIVYSVQAYIPGCPGLEGGAVIMITNLIINLVLFYQFYQSNYLEKTKQN